MRRPARASFAGCPSSRMRVMHITWILVGDRSSACTAWRFHMARRILGPDSGSFGHARFRSLAGNPAIVDHTLLGFHLGQRKVDKIDLNPAANIASVVAVFLLLLLLAFGLDLKGQWNCIHRPSQSWPGNNWQRWTQRSPAVWQYGPSLSILRDFH